MARPWCAKDTRRDSSTHTWAPRHVCYAPRGRNGTGPGAAYPFLAQAQERLSLVRLSHLNRAPTALKQRERVGERVPSRMPWVSALYSGSRSNFVL
uniref:Uncharacterized protein n=1 Tax=Vitis vinifera TaxID=29760 RepID=A5AEF2_VITVI|nr:hypothetical protein VITISV_011682 [Vitis vinifera]